jgi:hypothetical protein
MKYCLGPRKYYIELRKYYEEAREYLYIPESIVNAP